MITNKKAIELLTFMKSPSFDEFRFTISGNRKVQKALKSLESHVEFILSVEKKQKTPPPELVEAEKKQIEDIKVFCKVDAEGNLERGPQNQLVLLDAADEPKVLDIINKFVEENKESIDDFQESLMEWESFFIDEEADLELNVLNASEIKINEDNCLSTANFELLLLLVPSLGDEPV